MAYILINAWWILYYDDYLKLLLIQLESKQSTHKLLVGVPALSGQVIEILIKIIYWKLGTLICYKRQYMIFVVLSVTDDADLVLSIVSTYYDEQFTTLIALRDWGLILTHRWLELTLERWRVITKQGIDSMMNLKKRKVVRNTKII